MYLLSGSSGQVISSEPPIVMAEDSKHRQVFSGCKNLICVRLIPLKSHTKLFVDQSPVSYCVVTLSVHKSS